MDTVELRFNIHSFLVVSQSDTTTFVNLPVLEPIERYKKMKLITLIKKTIYVCMHDDRRMRLLMVYMKEQLIELRDIFVEWTIISFYIHTYIF